MQQKVGEFGVVAKRANVSARVRCLALKAGVGDERGVGECGSRRGRERGAPLTRIRTVR